MTGVDPRLYILGGLLLLAVVVFVYLVGALWRYRNAVRAVARRAIDVAPAGDMDTGLHSVGEPVEDVFAASSSAIEVALGTPLRTGAWRPDGEPVAVTTSHSATPPPRVDLESSVWDLGTAFGPTDLDEPEPAPAPAPARVQACAGPAIVHAPIGILNPVEEAAADSHESPLSTGNVLSAVSSMPAVADMVPLGPVVTPTEARPALVASATQRAAQDGLPEVDDVPEYVLVAPVELHFTLGEGRVGVRHGSRTFAEFQRLADVLMNDLHSLGGRRRL